MLYPRVRPGVMPSMPSTWKSAPARWSKEFSDELKDILSVTIIDELRNVIGDAKKNGGLAHRGHVIAIALLCAVDTLSSYAFRKNSKDMCKQCKRSDDVGPRYRRFIQEFFPKPYRKHAISLYGDHRNDLVHRWHLFSSAISAGNEPIESSECSVSFGLEHFFHALEESFNTFWERLGTDASLQKSMLTQYSELQKGAKSARATKSTAS